MEFVQENLEHYRDFKFFSLIEQNDKERKEKGDKKNKDPKKEQEEKIAVQTTKDVQAIVKKALENYKRFKSAAGSKMELYKQFWSKQNAAKEPLKRKDPGVKLIYNMWDSSYIVVGSIEAENAYLIVIKDSGELVCKINSKEGYESFRNFLQNMEADLQKVKDDYVRNVENKKKEEEEKQRREKLEGFLKEEKEEK